MPMSAQEFLNDGERVERLVNRLKDGGKANHLYKRTVVSVTKKQEKGISTKDARAVFDALVRGQVLCQINGAVYVVAA